MSTREGYQYRKDGSFHRGLVCSAVIEPQTHLSSTNPSLFDVIVLGAGYAGLTACRDLTLAGYKVLLLEARDRIGGRTYSAIVDGHLYEMGGTWIQWQQPHVYREMSRYGLTRMLDSNDFENTLCDYFTAEVDGHLRNMSKTEEETIVDEAFTAFCNVDGALGHKVLPYPHEPHFSPLAASFDVLSAAERIEQIREQLTVTHINILSSFIAAISGNNMQETGFLDILRWWALSGYSVAGLYSFTETYKISVGQSAFARAFFDESSSTGNLSYRFDTVVKKIEDIDKTVALTTTSGQQFTGKHLVCTVPLNVLHTIEFVPPLSQQREEAIKCGHIGMGAKYHLETEKQDLRAWVGAGKTGSRVLTVRGDGLTNTGGTHLVCFATNDAIRPEEDGKVVLEALTDLHPMDVKQVVWHNWLVDPFSQGTWCMFGPGYSTKYLNVLRERRGHVHFASGDWALGWRGFIDGAIEEGTRAAKHIIGSEMLGSRFT